jgi:hypothetical protein
VPIHEPSKVFKALDAKVSKSGRLVTLTAMYTDSYMRALDHMDIIGSISNSESFAILIFYSSNPLDELGFYSWSSPINDY